MSKSDNQAQSDKASHLPVFTNPGHRAASAFEVAWKAGEFAYGMVIPREWVEDAMGMSPDGILTPADTAIFRGQWMRAMSDMSRILLYNLKIHLVPHNNPPGYYILPPEDQTSYAVGEFVRGYMRVARRSWEVAENTNFDALTAEQKREASDHRATLRRLQSSVGKILEDAVPASQIKSQD